MNKPLWRLEKITEHIVLDDITSNEIYLGWVANASAAAMIA